MDLISFTGSTVTGKRIMEKGAATLKRVFLELGGKSAMIVCDDADLAQVLPAAGGVCYHAGQGCAVQSRVLLPRSRYAEGVEILKAVMENIPYGDPTDPATMQGPQVSAKQRDRVMSYIRKGIDEGAELIVGGGRPSHLDKGFFVEPTLFVDVDNSMTIAQEEIFGPVLAVIPYDDDEDAIRIANDSSYGLSGGVFSASPERAMAIAHRIRTGSISVNGGMWYGADGPYGGYKTSGIGRQNGVEGFENTSRPSSSGTSAERSSTVAPQNPRSAPDKQGPGQARSTCETSHGRRTDRRGRPVHVRARRPAGSSPSGGPRSSRSSTRSAATRSVAW